MPGGSERFEIVVQSALDELPESVTYPVLVIADQIGITAPELILYCFVVLVLIAVIFVPNLQTKKRTPD